MEESDAVELWVGATRYYLGRQTIAVSAFTGSIIRQWPYFSVRTKQIIQRDINEAFKQDDLDRLNGKDVKTLGANCDRQAWAKVRFLWQ